MRTNTCSFGSEPHNGFGFHTENQLFPAFDEETIEETGDYRIFRQTDGVVAQHYRGRSALPHYIDFTMRDRGGWPEYLRRLQPEPARIPPDLSERIAFAVGSQLPICIGTGSMVGYTRNWMGVTNFCMTCCEDPDLVAEVANAIADLVCWVLERVLPALPVSLGWGWEDICFKTGPLVPPEVFRHAATPAYRRVSDNASQIRMRPTSH